ncbi:fanconi anemia group J protein [Nematocida parisii]|nr:fanconi anemia group J protein [Nematocida parisii]
MYSENIKGYTITTKYELYEPQRQSIRTILNCLEEGVSGMIESPTGTGKTLSILESVVAWINKNKQNKEVKVYVTTRTIKQAQQLIEYFKTIRHAPKMSLLASRAHLCLNPEVRTAGNLDSACKNKNKDINSKNKCKYYSIDKESRTSSMENSLPTVFSIEDLIQSGSECSTCPYYYTKDMQDKSTIVFAPYNYIINKSIVKAMGIDLNGSIIIVDEAHNLDDICRSSGSVDIERIILDGILTKLTTETVNASIEVPEVFTCISIIKGIREYFDGVPDLLSEVPQDMKIYDVNGKQELSIPQKCILSELSKLGITPESVDKVFSDINGLIRNSVLDEFMERWLVQLETVFKLILSDGKQRDYGMVISEDKVSFILLRAAVQFDPIYKMARSVILLSGTLRPFPELVNELTYNSGSFKYFLSAGHVISDSQLYTRTVGQYNGHTLTGTYKETKNPVYFQTISRVITDIAHSLERVGGVLCFVPNYNTITLLKSKLEKQLLLYTESTDNGIFEDNLRKYRSKCLNGKCVFLCVFRGKASEGINFKDHESRAVVLVGIPYPNIRNHGIILKKQYNNQYMNGSGSKWYDQQAFRAVNQALGRCIRHKNDWGSIFMIDSRYGSAVKSSKISEWAVSNFNNLIGPGMLQEEYLPFIKQQKRTEYEENYSKNSKAEPENISKKRNFPGNDLKRFFNR